MFSRHKVLLMQLIFSLILTAATVGIDLANSEFTTATKQIQRAWVYRFTIDVSTPNMKCPGPGTPCSLTLVPDQPIDIVTSYKNYGASAARHVAIVSATKIGIAPPANNSDWTANTVPPIDCASELKDIDFGSMPPGELNLVHVSAKSRVSISKPDFDDIVAGKAGFYYRSCIFYEDIFEDKHYGELCGYLYHDAGSATGTVNQCVTGQRDQ